MTLTEKHMDYVRALAWKEARKYRQERLLDDLIQAGALGAWQAEQAYDPERGVKFTTFAHTWIIGAMQRYAQKDLAFGGFTLPNQWFEDTDYREAHAVPESRSISTLEGEDWVPGVEDEDTVVSREAAAQLLKQMDQDHRLALLEYMEAGFNLTEYGRRRGIGEEAARNQVGKAMRHARTIDPTLVVGEATVTPRDSGGVRREKGERL